MITGITETVTPDSSGSKRASKRLPLFLKTAFAAIFCLVSLCGRQTPVEWRTAQVEKGDLNVEVTASGTANPHSLVQVGTQVSGTIAHTFADFNSRVKKRQLIALLDTTFLHAAVEDAKASLNRALAQQNLAAQNAKRTRELFDQGLAAQADLDQTTADFESAKAAVSSAQSTLDRAKINLAYAFISSPIDGVVINRNVDVGQTVAASFSTPTLFTIADDLSKMQVQASIDEADIGQVKVGQTAHFTVDAYPDRQFTGTVSQIRLQPTTVQNVVTYTVVIDVENPDLAIMPGMTTNITITVQQAHDVLKVPQAALKFTPPGEKHSAADSGYVSRKTARGGESAARESPVRTGKPGSPDSMPGLKMSLAGGGAVKGGSSGVRADRSRGNRGGYFDRAQGAPAFAGGGARDSLTRSGRKKPDRIFILEDGKPKRVTVTSGLSGGGYIAVEGELKPGQLVIVGTIGKKTGAQDNQQRSILGGGPPGGAGGGGMPRRM